MNKEVAIDPSIHRPEKENWSFRTAVVQTFTQSCSAVPKSEMVQGGDISQWQGEMDWNKFFDNGMKYTVIRAMINGGTDTQFDRNAQTLIDQKRWFSVYGATGYPTLANAIPYARKLADLVDGMPYLSVWWDSEASGLLSPYEMSKYNSELLGELNVLLPGSILEIYTRQSFWDSHIQAGNWNKYSLAAARYNEQLTCPWSDGKYIFRDWDDWRYWQLTQCWDGYAYGAKSRCIDGLLFNGNETMYKDVYGINEIPPGQTCCEENAEIIEQLRYDLMVLTADVDELKENSHTHDDPTPPEPLSDTITVIITEKHKAHYFKDTDDSCPSKPGKPKMLTDDIKPSLVVNQRFQCDGKVVYSCHDVSSPTIIASGGELFYRISEEGNYKGRFIRKDKSMIV